MTSPANLFRTKSVVIEAIQLGRSPQSLHDVLEFIGSTRPYADQDEDNETHAIVIPTLDGGSMRASVGDWVIRAEGEICVCKPDTFAATYESAASPSVPALGASLHPVMQEALAPFLRPAPGAAAPSAPPEGDWLWRKLMDWCKSRRVHPSDYNDLFAIVGEARAAATRSPE